MKDWQHKDIWTLRTQHFTVQVEHREETPARESLLGREGPHRWNVYAYIYPTHPHFHKFEGAGLWQEACQVLPLHGGATYLKYHTDALNGLVTSVQVGCDYHHDGDLMYTYDASRDDAGRQFRDAEELFDWLERARMTVEA